MNEVCKLSAGEAPLIEELRNIGLSDLEARCYLALHEEANLSGYEVAKRVSVSRTNVYAALRSLTDKGMCRSIEADPVLYDAVPIGQLAANADRSIVADLWSKDIHWVEEALLEAESRGVEVVVITIGEYLFKLLRLLIPRWALWDG